MGKNMWLVLGIVLLFLDIYVGASIDYPKYEIVSNAGADTQRMVMEDVVGSSMKVDLVPDIAGYLILFFVAINFTGDKKQRTGKLLCCLFAIVVEVLAMVLPFYTSGIFVYGGEYLLHWLKAFIEAVTIYLFVSGSLRLSECKETHLDNIVAEIFMFLAIAGGFVKEIGRFYGLTRTTLVYYVLAGLFTVLCLWKMLVCERDFNAQNKEL